MEFFPALTQSPSALFANAMLTVTEIINAQLPIAANAIKGKYRALFSRECKSGLI